jgi:hypothetical protein
LARWCHRFASKLLGRANPVRAVLGHAEPTFDWTLRVAETGQGLGQHIVSALSTNFFNEQPVGYAFSDYRAGVGELHTQWDASAVDTPPAPRRVVESAVAHLRLVRLAARAGRVSLTPHPGRAEDR